MANVFEQVIFIPEEEAIEMEKILSIEEGYYEGAGRDEVIQAYSTEFRTPYGDYGVDIKVCNGDTPYVDPVLFQIVKDENGREVWCEMFPLDVCEDLLGEYEFEFEEDGKNLLLRVVVQIGEKMSLDEKIRELRKEIYFMEEIQEGAKPYIEVNEDKKNVEIAKIYMSCHYDEDDDIPSVDEVAEKIRQLVQISFPDYISSIEIIDTNGNRHLFS